MKTSLIIASVISVTASLANAQYTDDDNPLIIGSDTDYYEEYTNRSTDSSAQNSVYITGQPNSSYSAKNINISNYYAGYESFGDIGYGIRAYNVKSANITADPGTWNVVSTYGNVSIGVNFRGLSQESGITNTKVYNYGNEGIGINIWEAATVTYLDNIEIHLSTSTADGMTGTGIFSRDAIVSNQGKGAITITSDHSGYANSAIQAQRNATVDLYNATIDVYKTSATGGVINSNNSTVNLTNSTISSSDGNNLVSAATNTASTISLNNVNLDNALNQQLIAQESNTTLNINLLNGTNFHGHTGVGHISAQVNISLESGASWYMSDISDMNGGSLKIGDGGIFIVGTDTNNDFLDLNNAVVMLEQGGILQLDKDSSVFTMGEELALTDILGSGSSLSNNGGAVVTSDGIMFSYNSNTQMLTLTGNMIPEPATSLLGLLAMGMVTVRRRKTF